MLINLRNALMSGKRLPYDAEVEYLESTGTQWIDTGVFPDFDMIARIMLSYQQDSCYPVWGTRGTSYNNRAYTSAYNTNAISTSTFYNGQFDDASASNITNIKPAIGQIFDFKLSKDGGWLNGVKVNEWQSTPQPFTPYGTIYLFGRNDPANTKAACRIYHFSLELNGVLVRDFIPVRVGSGANAVGYMYDRVTCKLFGNEGTGDFVLGPDVVPVEYIESTGTQWIDTGVVPGGKIINAEVAFKQLRLNGTVSAIIGSTVNDGSDNFQFTCFDSKWRLKLNNYASFYGAQDTNTHVLKLNTAQGTFLDSRQLVTSQYTINATNTKNIYLGACNYNGSTVVGVNTYRLIGELYYAKIYANSILVHSFRPVRVGTGTTWAGAMMDVLTRCIYRNAGTGAFTWGNDLRYPIPSE